MARVDKLRPGGADGGTPSASKAVLRSHAEKEPSRWRPSTTAGRVSERARPQNEWSVRSSRTDASSCAVGRSSKCSSRGIKR
eukprot:6181160-Pleurochrysis_carterae.AAC.5